MTKRIYYCANVWISFISQEAGRYQSVAQDIKAAQNGHCEIWTSTISLAEVYKSHATGQAATQSNSQIDALFTQRYVQMVAVDFNVARDARDLLRAHNPPLRKPFDAIHLATALRNNCDEFHTFDRVDLLTLNGSVNRQDGAVLVIKKP